MADCHEEQTEDLNAFQKAETKTPIDSSDFLSLTGLLCLNVLLVSCYVRKLKISYRDANVAIQIFKAVFSQLPNVKRSNFTISFRK